MHEMVLDSDSISLVHVYVTNLLFNQVDPSYADYFFEELVPWKHYVPVHQNMSNLIDTINYVVADSNQKEMRRIVRQANKWCKNKMTSTQMAVDLLWILISYSELLYSSDFEEGNFESGLSRLRIDDVKMTSVGGMPTPIQAILERPTILLKSVLLRLSPGLMVMIGVAVTLAVFLIASKRSSRNPNVQYPTKIELCVGFRDKSV